MAAAAAPSVATSPSPSPAPAPKVASPKAGDRKVVPVDAVELKLEEKHVLAVDDSSVDRAVIAKILRSSKYRGEQSTQFFLDWFIKTWKEGWSCSRWVCSPT